MMSIPLYIKSHLHRVFPSTISFEFQSHPVARIAITPLYIGETEAQGMAQGHNLWVAYIQDLNLAVNIAQHHAGCDPSFLRMGKF